MKAHNERLRKPRGLTKAGRREAFLTEAQRLSMTGSFGWNVGADVHFWSDETYRIFGYEPGTRITLQSVLDRVHPEDLPLVQRTAAAAAQGMDFDYEYRLLLPCGTVRHVHIVAHATKGSRESLEFVGAVMDITERKRVEEALRRSEAFLEEGQRISRTGSWMWNPVTGEMIWSKERFRLFGLDPEKTKPSFEAFWERVHPEDKPKVRESFASAAREKRDFEIEYRIVTPDWSIRHLHSVGHTVINESAEMTEFIGTTMDITDRKRAEERAQQQKEAIRLALNSFVEQLDLDRFLGHVICGLTRQFRADSSELWLFDDATDAASLHMAFPQGRGVIAFEGAANMGLQPENPPVTWTARKVGRIPRVIQIPAEESALDATHFRLLMKQGVKTLMKVPLAIGEQILGVFELDFVEAARFTPADLDVAQALVHHATLALQLSRLARRTETLAVIEERNRMAREIHDTLAQSFAGIVLHSEALGGSLVANKARTKRALELIKKLARSGLEEARRSVQALRPKALEGSTLPEALEQAATRLSKDAKLHCEFKQRGKALKMSPEVQDELFRIAQEAMTNVRKHSRAGVAWITLEFESREVVLAIGDDGVGLATAGAPDRKVGYGLASMHERAQRIGGRLDIESPEKGGTVIRVTVPVARKAKPPARLKRAVDR